MNYIYLIPLLIFFIIIYVDRTYTHRIVLKEFQKLQNLKSKILTEKLNVNCSTFTVGRKNLGFHYKKADLYFLDDALIIIGYYTVFGTKIYRSVLVLTNEIDYYKSLFKKADEITTPKQLNTNSTNNDVYIEFGNAGFTSTNVTILLKDLSELEKKQINL